MEKRGNLIRIIVWSILIIVCIALGLIGYLKFNESYSKYKNDLLQIVNTFNNTETIKNYEDIGTKIVAEVKRNKIIVTYDGINYKNYIYTLKNNGLETTYEENDSISNVIAMVMIDTINIIKNNANSGETYSIYSTEKIKNYTFDEGVSYKLNGSKIELKINILKSVLDKNPPIIETNKINIPISKQLIEVGTIITEDMIQLVSFDKNNVPTDILYYEDILGKEAIIEIQKDTFFYESMLENENILTVE